RIEFIWRGKRFRRADVEAAAALAAAVVVALVRREVERREDRTEKEPRTELPRDEVRVLALPAEPRGFREGLLHHGRGVDEDLHLRARPFREPAGNLLQPLLDEVVVVAVLRIDR